MNEWIDSLSYEHNDSIFANERCCPTYSRLWTLLCYSWIVILTLLRSFCVGGPWIFATWANKKLWQSRGQNNVILRSWPCYMAIEPTLWFHSSSTSELIARSMLSDDESFTTVRKPFSSCLEWIVSLHLTLDNIEKWK